MQNPGATSSPRLNRRIVGSPLARAGNLGLALLALLPILSLATLAGANAPQAFNQLGGMALPESVATTIALVAGVGILTSFTGLVTAWLVSRYRFFGRGWMSWALVLPLSIPTYLAAYCFIEATDFTGPVQGLIRAIGGFKSPAEYWFPDFRSLPGAIFILSGVLYPYVYLSCRLMFVRQGGAMIESARVLGAGGWQVFARIAAPMSRPAIAAGATLAMLETLNDIGAVEILGVRSLAFSVFDTWLNRSNLGGAAQIACVTLVFVALIMAVERKARGSRSYAAKITVETSPIRLSGSRGALAFLVCLLPVAAGFITPLLVMGGAAIRRLGQIGDAQLAQAALNTFAVSLATAILASAAAFLLLYGARRTSGRPLDAAIRRAAMLGYAIPGPVLAIGTLYVFTGFDNGFDAFMRARFGISSGLLLSGSAAIIVYACSVRFLMLAHGTMEAGYTRLTDHASMAARTLGRTGWQTLIEVELPLMKRAVATAGLFVFVDTAKELPATLILRPFNFPTLATHVYEKASQARFEDGSLAALAIVLLGAVPLLVLGRVDRSVSIEKEKAGR